MQVETIRAVTIDVTPQPRTVPRTPRQASGGFVSPMARYPELPRASWTAPWRRCACVVTVADGTWGLGVTLHAGPVERLISDHFAPVLVGQNCLATEKLWDILQRISASYGTGGLASYAISAVDLALWDLKGKLLGRPVYELLGGPQKDRIFCYASNTDLSYSTEESLAWFLELGFRAVKVFLREGPDAGLAGLRRSEALVARAREQVGDDVELMVDGWMSLDLEYAGRLAEALRPYRLKWLEDLFLPDDLDSYARLRQHAPGATLAAGEHWYGVAPFATAASQGLVDIHQPDVAWVGGLSAAVRICHLAEAHGQRVITHAGMNYPWGQHLAYAMPVIPWGERSEGVAPPGVPLEELVILPGTVPIRDGFVRPNDAPGFGLEVTLEWLEQHAV